MKKKTHLLCFALLCLIGTFYSCKSEEQHEVDHSVTLEVGGLTFRLQENDFGQDIETATRAADTRPQTMDLGNGIEAEVSLEAEDAPSTRAPKPLSNGSYTIVAFKDGTRIGQKLTATVAGGSVTLTSANPKKRFSWLDAGTYTFVCYNSKVTDDNGNTFTVAREDVKDALFDAQTITLGNTDQQVSFALKHPGARIRTKIVAEMALPVGFASTLNATGSNDVPQSTVYNGATGATTPTHTGAAINTSSTYPSSGTWDFDNDTEAAITSNEYQYFLTGTKCNKLSWNITAGKVYHTTASSTTPLAISLSNTTAFAANASYVLKVKLNYNHTYLFSNHTTGWLRNQPAGTVPIGVVVDKDKQLAIALKDAHNGDKSYWVIYDPGTNFNKSTFTTFAQCKADMQGEYWTWDPNSTSYEGPYSKATGGKGWKDFWQGFRYAAEYTTELATELNNKHINMPTTLANKKWYMPSMGEWIEALKALGFANSDDISNWEVKANWYKNIANKAFTDTRVQGQTILEKDYMTSTMSGKGFPAWGVYLLIKDGSTSFKNDGSTFPTRSLRSFIHY